MTVPTDAQVASAAAAIVAAFAATDTDAYFASFSPDATFLFHTERAVLPDRASYEELWAGWLADGWRVVECTSSNPVITTYDGGAAFAHDVHTAVEVGGEREEYDERESIIFAVADGRLVAVHEHLSPAPSGGES